MLPPRASRIFTTFVDYLREPPRRSELLYYLREPPGRSKLLYYLREPPPKWKTQHRNKLCRTAPRATGQPVWSTKIIDHLIFRLKTHRATVARFLRQEKKSAPSCFTWWFMIFIDVSQRQEKNFAQVIGNVMFYDFYRSNLTNGPPKFGKNST